jgi:uncharacterized oxidoreductase
MRLTDNTILITGGTSGIGRALAESFHRLGNTVIITGRRQHLLDEITGAHPGMRGLPLDVGDPFAIDVSAKQIHADFPDLNVLINNAGIAAAEDLTAGAFDLTVSRSVIETNVIGTLHVTSALLPLLKGQPHATIITTSSGLAFLPNAASPTYSATKAFLHSWLQSLRFQLRSSAVEVLELVPPYVQTELNGPDQANDQRAMPLADYVAEVMQLLGVPDPPRGEILVDRAKQLRFAEASGNYDQVFMGYNDR